MVELSATLVPVLGRALLHFVWQGAAIGLVAVVALQCLRDARPQARYAVACSALLACALAPLATLLVLVAGPGTGGIASVLPEDDPRRQLLLATADRHLAAGLELVASGHYEGDHWLASFAVLAMTGP